MKYRAKIASGSPRDKEWQTPKQNKMADPFYRSARGYGRRLGRTAWPLPRMMRDINVDARKGAEKKRSGRKRRVSGGKARTGFISKIFSRKSRDR